MVYYIHWVDKYSGGYRVGATHASVDGSKSLCGIDYTNKPMDGGYQTTEELEPECKRCRAKMNLLKLKQKES